MKTFKKKIQSQSFFYILVGIVLFSCLSLSKNSQEFLRDKTVAITTSFIKKYGDDNTKEPVIKDNFLLREKIQVLTDLLSSLKQKRLVPPTFPSILEPYFSNMVACKILHRDITHWSNFLWVNVGKIHGIRKQSPVLSEGVLVGIVDYVGEKQSRIRLITDLKVNPSVISCRDGMESFQIKTLIHQLQNLILKMTIDNKMQQEWIETLEKIVEEIPINTKNTFSARGVLLGSPSPLKENKNILIGEGFYNTDKSDQQIIIGDILVTTGLDGVFPPGLGVASVTYIHPIQEGNCSYRIEAKLLINDMDILDTLYILPPLAFNPNDRPDIFGLLWN